MPSTTLVTGAAGFAGSHLLDLLARDSTANAGAAAVVAWHRPGRARPDGPPHVRWQAVDVLDRQSVQTAIAEVRPSAVYHCAGAAHVGRAWDDTVATLDINVRGTHNVLAGLERLDIESRLLIPSSALVYAAADRALTERDPLAPTTPYGLSKLAQELLAHHVAGPVRVTVARAFNHVGPRQDPHFAASGFARRIADIERGRWEPTISVGNLDARRDLTDVRDTVRAYRLILERGEPSGVFNVCSGRAVAIRDVLDALIARARVPVSVKIDPARYRPIDTPLLVGDPARARERFGWSPEIPLERTLEDLLEYWRHRE